jgi:hypothetical protein
MLLAQLHRKVPSEFEGMEDVLTSSVFGVFKYLPQELARTSLAEWAEIPSLESPILVELWPRCPTPPGFVRPGELTEEDEDPASRGDTEPDVVITSEEWLILVEAKYRSPLDEYFDQLGREFVIGRQLARETERRFRMLVVTGHTLRPTPAGVDLASGLASVLRSASAEVGATSKDVIGDVEDSLRWTSWQRLYVILSATCRERTMPDGARSLIGDLCDLLELRGLKPYDEQPLISALTRWEEGAMSDEPWSVSFNYSYGLPFSVASGWEQLLPMDSSALGAPIWHPEISRSDYSLGIHLGGFDLESLRAASWSPSYQAWR